MVIDKITRAKTNFKEYNSIKSDYMLITIKVLSISSGKPYQIHD